MSTMHPTRHVSKPMKKKNRHAPVPGRPDQPAQFVLGRSPKQRQILHEDIYGNLEQSIWQGVIDDQLPLHIFCGGIAIPQELMMDVVREGKPRKPMHEKMDPIKDEIVKPDPKSKFRRKSCEAG